MENDHFSRNIENDETIYFSSIVHHCENKRSEDYPIMIYNSTQADKDNLSILHSNERNKNIAIRGFPIADQVSTNHLPHEYSDRSMVVIFFAGNTRNFE